jgi:hypothetical protein
MKLLRVLVIGLVVAGAAVFLSGLACAEEGCTQGKKMHHEAKIKLLQDAATALQKSNPDLAKGLQGMCEGKAKGKVHKTMHKKAEHTSGQGETK